MENYMVWDLEIKGKSLKKTGKAAVFVAQAGSKQIKIWVINPPNDALTEEQEFKECKGMTAQVEIVEEPGKTIIYYYLYQMDNWEAHNPEGYDMEGYDDEKNLVKQGQLRLSSRGSYEISFTHQDLKF